MTAQDGTVSWRNNNPGNLKFEFEGSADKTVHSTRSKEKALEQAQSRYGGVVDVMQAVQTPLAQSSQDAAVDVQNNTQQAQVQSAKRSRLLAALVGRHQQRDGRTPGPLFLRHAQAAWY
ncbi:hypothetical protein [Luteibacter sp. dw_328]|uniref:hypothetical protein n=1 Tax=Luteibacter sp. dw_328 TaxID=2719796 RepID=UPI001BD52A0E|nr:hypothetical protein [Luteibacter sp. dw_328]